MADAAISRLPPAESKRGPGRPPTHGLYSKAAAPAFEQRAVEVAEALMSLPHTHPVDQTAALEVGRALAIIEAIDLDLAKRGLLSRGGAPRKLLAERRAWSRLLLEHEREFGATPRARAEWAAVMAQGGIAAEIARRRAENGPEAT